MARKLARGGDSDERSLDDRSDRSMAVDRREFVRFVSAALGTVISMTGAAGASSEIHGLSDESRIRQLRIVGTGDISKYELTVDGELASDPHGSKDAAARVSGVSAEGVVTEGNRIYLFSGEIQDFTLKGNAGVYLQTDGNSSELSLRDAEYASRSRFQSVRAERDRV